MKKWSTIATWKMAFDGVVDGAKLLADGAAAGDAVEKMIMNVEDNSAFVSVGYGGLPNRRGVVELDAAFMDGNTYQYGAVGAIRDFKNPIRIARKLATESSNNFLTGAGAEEYACFHGFERRNMLTPSSHARWEERLRKEYQTFQAYDGHDTVCVICLDEHGSIVAGTSTSGLFMKEPGRIGDSPLLGAGFYADSLIGAAAATGVGEDITRGCLSYEAVKRMERGMSPQLAASTTVLEFAEKLTRLGKTNLAISLICMDKNGDYGVGTTLEFPFVAASSSLEPSIFVSNQSESGTVYERASNEWLENPSAD